VCHHTSFKNVGAVQNKRGKSKNLNCPAKIIIKVKKDTADTRKKDKYIKVRVKFNIIVLTIFISEKGIIHVLLLLSTISSVSTIFNIIILTITTTLKYATQNFVI